MSHNIDEEKYIGVADDLRPTEEKSRDWTEGEVSMGATQIVWRKKKPPTVDFQPSLGPRTWRKFGLRSQKGGSCVSHSHAKALGIENHVETGEFLVESARPIYFQRAGKPAAGMSSIDAFKFCTKKGTTSEARLKSFELRDEEMDKPFPWEEEDARHAETYRASGYVTIFNHESGHSFDISAVARAIEETKCGVILHVFATGQEYKRPQPYIGSPNLRYEDSTVRHAVIAVDYTLTDKGEKALVIDESYANDDKNKGQRILTEEFLLKRCRFAGRYLPKPNDLPLCFAKPVLQRDLAWQCSGEDVRALQAYLRAKGFFPAAVEPTGLWKQITAQAVRKWQVSKGILDFQSSPDADVRFGTKSRNALSAE